MEPAAPARRDEHLPVLDALRGVAIVLVLLFHGLGAGPHSDHLEWAGWYRAWPPPLSFWALLPAYFGWSGVAIFFVISGFCIHWSHQRSRDKSLRSFFLRRFFRIYPPYLLALLFFAFCFPATRLIFSSRHNIDQFISHLLLLHNDLGGGFVFGINGAWWSIGAEAQLYLLYPVLLFFAQRWGWNRALALTGAIEIALRALAGVVDTRHLFSPLWLFGNPLIYSLSWTLGAALAERWRKGQPLGFGKFPVSFWVAFAVGSYLVRPLAGFGFMFWSLATAAFLARVLSGAWPVPAAFRPGSFLQKIGLISYSVYLLHQPLLATAAQFGARIFAGEPLAPWAGFLGALASWPVIFLISWGFYGAVERPSIRLGRWLQGRRHQAKSPEPLYEIG